MQQGSKELYQAVRGALITNGTTLNRWCQENQITRQWAEKALKGERRGVQSLKLLKRIAAVAGRAPVLAGMAAGFLIIDPA